MLRVSTSDALLLAGVFLVAAGVAAILWAAFGPLVAVGSAGLLLGLVLVVAAVLLGLAERRELADRSSRGETPTVPGRDA